MPDRAELEAALRSVADDLEARSRAVTPESALARAAGGATRPRAGRSARGWSSRVGLLLAAVVLVALVLGVVAVLDGDGDEPVVAGPSPTSMTTTGVDEPVDPERLADAVTGLAVLASNSEVADVLALEGSSPVLRRIGQVPVADEIVVGTAGLLDLTFDAGQARLTPSMDPAEVPAGCDGAVGIGGVRVAQCGDEPDSPDQLSRFNAFGASTSLAGMPPEHVAGHWRWLVPSPDGATVLAQWSGECEVPSAWFVSPIDGAIEPALAGGSWDVTIGLGWLPDGRAVVQVLPAGCGASSEAPGVYAVDPLGAAPPHLLLPTPEPVSVFLWRTVEHAMVAPEAPLVATLARATAELGVEFLASPEAGFGGADVLASEDGVAGTIDWRGTQLEVRGEPIVGAFPYVPFGETAGGEEPIELAGGFAATAGVVDHGRFVAVTCGNAVWVVTAGHVVGTAPAAEALAALVPRLYCTLGMAPLVSHEEDLSPQKHDQAQDLADRLRLFAEQPSAETLAAIPFADEVMLGLGDAIVRRASRDELIDPATWVLHGAAFERDGPFSALDVLAGHRGPIVAQLRVVGCGSQGRPPPDELVGYDDFGIVPSDVAYDTCINWFGVYVYQHPVTGDIAGVTVELGTP